MKEKFLYFGDIFNRFDCFWVVYKQYLSQVGIQQFEEDNHLIVEISLPGRNKENINLFIEDDKIFITAEPLENKFANFKLEKTFVLKSGIYDISGLTAKMENGILTFLIPKKNGKEKKSIQIF